MAQPNWITTQGSLGSFPAQVAATTIVIAQPVFPAVSVTYTLISGTLPQGLTLSTLGVISGTPSLVTSDTTSTFVIRATDNLSNIRDRTFYMIISGVASPTLVEDSLPTIDDSTWVEIQIGYNNPVPNNEINIRVIQGQLPPGLEINSTGLIRGYASPPTINVNLGLVNTSITSVNSNLITAISLDEFIIGRPIIFTGTSFGGIVAGQTYYIRSISENQLSFTISTSANGPTVDLFNDVGYMTATLPNISVGQPTVRTYSFTLKLESLLGSDLQSYSIKVENQNSPDRAQGPKNENSRVPTIYNTRPPTYLITESTPYFGYYVLPPDSQGYTYSPTENAFIGKITSDNIFSFKVIGKDFDNNILTYSFANLPLGLTGDSVTGWITGNPVIADNSISEFSFSVAVSKASNPGITTPSFNFSFIVTNDIVGDVIWITPANLGVIENSTVSTITLLAESDAALQYRLISGQLPPNLTLLSNGDIAGTVAYQPIDTLLDENDTTDFTFTVQAYSPLFPVVQSTKTFTLTVTQEYVQPTDTLYIKCAPSIPDRNLIRDLLTNEQLIPNNYIYRPEDPNFGKATNVTYVHAYGIFANDLDAYVAAVTKNHYWRNITLGEIKTAVAKNDQGEIIYEVVYSSVIDNLINPEGVSVSKEIFWPRDINLNLGPWYTSVTNLYTSYIGAPQQGQLLSTENNNTISTEDLLFIIGTESGQPAYYTSLSPGYARTLYPNSLPNMREQVGDELGQEYNFRLYPKWMTSQQRNGSTLGFTPAWVIAYCKPGTTTLPNGSIVSYAEKIKYNIENNWKTPVTEYTISLNEINFKIDRFAVDKRLTYNYDNNLSPVTWTGLPSATPTPDPSDSKDFFVLFPRETILPDETQY